MQKKRSSRFSLAAFAIALSILFAAATFLAYTFFLESSPYLPEFKSLSTLSWPIPLLFLISGVGLASLCLHKKWISFLSGCVLILAGLSLGFFAISRPFLPWMFVLDSSHIQFYSPFYSAFAFFLTGLILLLSAYSFSRRKSIVLLLELLSTMIVVLAVTVLSRALSGSKFISETPMNTLPEICAGVFILLGFGLLSQTLGTVRVKQEKKTVPALPYYAGFLLIIFSVVVWDVLNAHESEQTRNLLRLKAELIRERISSTVEVQIQSLSRLVRQTEGSELEFPAWASSARECLRDGGFEAVVKLDPAGTARWSVPSDKAEVVRRITFTQLFNSVKSVYRQDSPPNVLISPVIELSGKENVFLIAMPYLKGKKLEGFVSGVVDLNAILRSLFLEDTPEYSLDFRDGRRSIVSITGLAHNDFDPSESAETTVQMKNFRLTAKLQPTAVLFARTHSPMPEVALILGLVLSVLGSLLLYFAQVSRYRSSQMRLINRKLEEEINEKIFAEDRIRKSEKQLAEAQRLAHIGSWIWSPVTATMTWSDELFRIFGFAPQEFSVSFEFFIHCIHPDDRQFVQKIIEISYHDGKAFNFEHRIVRPNGDLRSILANGYTIRDESGSVIRVIGTAQDITLRKKAEEAFRREKEFSDLLIQHTIDGIMAFNRDGICTAWNPAMERITGLGRDEGMGRNIFEIFPFMRESGEDKMLIGTLTGKASVAVDRAFEVPETGRRGVYDAYYSPIRDATGAIIGGLAILHEISERKEAEKQRVELMRSQIARREAEKSVGYFRSMADSAPVLIWMADIDGKFSYFNKPWLEFTGRSLEQEMGNGWLENVHSEDLAECMEVYEKNFRERQTFRMEYRLKRGDGQYRWVLVSGVPLFDERGEFSGYIGSCIDITERKEMEEALKHQTQELARSNSELGQFAYVASHDLQEPLRMVASYTQLLAERYSKRLDSDAGDFISFATEGAMRAQQLVNDLLEYSRVDTRGKQFEMTDCNSVLQRVLSNLKLAIEESSAEITIDPMPSVFADESQLAQLFQNLIGNAIKFRKKDECPKVRITAKHNKSEWLFSVCDYGIGIDPQYKDRIFVIFQRLHTKAEYPGTGIGLSICKKIVERHGGKIWVESRPGAGSCFYFTLKT